jgi:hypothetical protein
MLWSIAVQMSALVEAKFNLIVKQACFSSKHYKPSLRSDNELEVNWIVLYVMVTNFHRRLLLKEPASNHEVGFSMTNPGRKLFTLAWFFMSWYEILYPGMKLLSVNLKLCMKFHTREWHYIHTRKLHYIIPWYGTTYIPWYGTTHILWYGTTYIIPWYGTTYVNTLVWNSLLKCKTSCRFQKSFEETILSVKRTHFLTLSYICRSIDIYVCVDRWFRLHTPSTLSRLECTSALDNVFFCPPAFVV